MKIHFTLSVLACYLWEEKFFCLKFMFVPVEVGCPWAYCCWGCTEASGGESVPRQMLLPVPSSYPSGEPHHLSETSKIWYCFQSQGSLLCLRVRDRRKGQGIDTLQQQPSSVTVWSRSISSWVPLLLGWERSLPHCFPIAVHPSHPCETDLIIHIDWLPLLLCFTSPTSPPLVSGSPLK